MIYSRQRIDHRISGRKLRRRSGAAGAGIGRGLVWKRPLYALASGRHRADPARLYRHILMRWVSRKWHVASLLLRGAASLGSAVVGTVPTDLKDVGSVARIPACGRRRLPTCLATALTTVSAHPARLWPDIGAVLRRVRHPQNAPGPHPSALHAADRVACFRAGSRQRSQQVRLH